MKRKNVVPLVFQYKNIELFEKKIDKKFLF
jgi:hypothetical protein